MAQFNYKPSNYATISYNKAKKKKAKWVNFSPKRKKPKKSKPAPLIDAYSSDFLSSYAWKTIRIKALMLYGAKCCCCGSTPESGEVMNVDHIKPRKTHPELALNINNLQILCSSCNKGKGNWCDKDFRTDEQISLAKNCKP